MKRKISVLPPEVINQIAAGEVVERPASVIKELVENALDAESTTISVRAAGGGVSMLEVSDDGLGMDRVGAQEACKRYATSKIKDVGDLLRLRSLGFRGEALYAIASVSRLELVTRPYEDHEGTRILVEGGKIVEVSAWGSPPGTRVRVEDLFYNVPARRKFLRTTKTEAHHIRQVLERVAMVQPEVGFHYEYEGKQALDCTPSVQCDERVRRLWGKDVYENLYPVHYGNEGFVLDGFLSHPNFHRSTASWVWFYVNARSVLDRGLLHALIRGYGSLLERGRYPVGVLRITLDPSEVDVNVHPTKREVKFQDPHRVQGLVVAAARRFLTEQPWVSEVLRDTGPHARAFEEDPLAGRGVAELDPGLSFVRKTPGPQTRTQEVLFSDEGNDLGLGEVRFLGQVRGTYLIFSGLDGLLIVDQHAAHERVLFDRIQAQMDDKGGGYAQALLLDEMVELTPIQSENLEKLRGILSNLGWDLEPFGGSSWRIKTVPHWMDPSQAFDLLREILDECAVQEEHPRSWETLVQRILAHKACRWAVKGGRHMEEKEALTLLEEMRATPAKGLCPHGRPTVIEIPITELRKRFGRA